MSMNENSYLTSYKSQRPGPEEIPPRKDGINLDEKNKEKKLAEEYMDLHEAYQVNLTY